MNSTVSVLVVEDEPAIAADVSEKLARMGYRVPAIASQAEEAFLAASAIHPDVVLMDINLLGPGDGIQAASRIQTTLDVPVVFLTAHDDLETFRLAQGADPFGYLTKPARPVDLANAIEVALTRYRSETTRQLREIWLEAQLQSAGEGLIAASHDGSIRFINAEGERLLGVAGKDVLGKRFAEAIPLRDKSTGAPLKDFVRLAFFEGSTLEIGFNYVVNIPEERGITGEVAICKVAGHAVGVVFTFRDCTVQSYVPDALCNNVLASDRFDCARTPTDLNSVIAGMVSEIRVKLPNGARLETALSDRACPILANRHLLQTVVSGLVGNAAGRLAHSGTVRISTTGVGSKHAGAEPGNTQYVRLRVGSKPSPKVIRNEPESRALRSHAQNIHFDMGRVQSALQSLGATARSGTSDGWSYWDVFVPVMNVEGPASTGELATVIVVEADLAVLQVITRDLEGRYDCLGARDAEEALDLARAFSGAVDVLVISEEARTAAIDIALDEFPDISLLLVTSDTGTKYHCVPETNAPSAFLESLCSRSHFRMALGELCQRRLNWACGHRRLTPS